MLGQGPPGCAKTVAISGNTKLLFIGIRSPANIVAMRTWSWRQACLQSFRTLALPVLV